MAFDYIAKTQKSIEQRKARGATDQQARPRGVPTPIGHPVMNDTPQRPALDRPLRREPLPRTGTGLHQAAPRRCTTWAKLEVRGLLGILLLAAAFTATWYCLVDMKLVIKKTRGYLKRRVEGNMNRGEEVFIDLQPWTFHNYANETGLIRWAGELPFNKLTAGLESARSAVEQVLEDIGAVNSTEYQLPCDAQSELTSAELHITSAGYATLDAIEDYAVRDNMTELVVSTGTLVKEMNHTIANLMRAENCWRSVAGSLEADLEWTMKEIKIYSVAGWLWFQCVREIELKQRNEYREALRGRHYKTEAILRNVTSQCRKLKAARSSVSQWQRRAQTLHANVEGEKSLGSLHHAFVGLMISAPEDTTMHQRTLDEALRRRQQFTIVH